MVGAEIESQTYDESLERSIPSSLFDWFFYLFDQGD
jgi:hypothetical protein